MEPGGGFIMPMGFTAATGGQRLRIGVDIGGTFTDVVVFDEARNEITLAKALSTPQELARGVQEALVKAGAPLGQASFLIHGSTIVVNAIVERRGAKTALVTTKGFRDVYEIGRINRPESFNLRFRKHRPLVPRELIFEVPERLMADGSVYLPFDEAKARDRPVPEDHDVPRTHDGTNQQHDPRHGVRPWPTAECHPGRGER